VSVVPGKREGAKTHELVRDFQKRTEGRLMNLMTSDEYPVYAEAIRDTYATTTTPLRTGKPGRPKGPRQVLPEGLKYATVHKTRQKGRVVKVETRVVFGTLVGVLAALAVSLVSKVVNTVYVERHNGTDRNRNSRKVRKSYAFSKDWEIHEAVTRFSMYSYNFCWAVRTLREGNRDMGYSQRTPAMAAGLTDHVWSLREWLTFPMAPGKRITQVA
jgi:IS1 family transposase